MNFWLCRERAALHIWRWSPCQVRPRPWMLLKPVLPPEIKEIQQVYCHSGESIRGSCSSRSSRVWVHVIVIRDTCSCEGHQGYMFMCGSSRVHVHVNSLGKCSLEIYWVFMRRLSWVNVHLNVHVKVINFKSSFKCLCEHLQVEILTYINWKFIRCKSCFEVHQIHGKLTFIRVQEIFERFARALSLWIFLATSELLA